MGVSRRVTVSELHILWGEDGREVEVSRSYFSLSENEAHEKS